jgi:DNA-binding MarR family transcriptional regulator
VIDPAPDDCPTPQELALLERWDLLHTGLRRVTDRLLCDVAHATGLSPSSFRVLCFLLTAPGNVAPMKQLTETLGFTTAGTTKVADRLAEAGLVERRSEPADRRVILTALTEHGRRTATTAARTFAQALRQRVTGPLGEEQFASLVAIIGRLGDTPQR